MNCINPGDSKPADSETTKLTIIGEQHTYLVCRMGSINKLLIDLNTEISKTSTDAGIIVRNMLRILEDVAMIFMMDARKEIGKQSQLVQAEVDARDKKINEGYNKIVDSNNYWSLDHSKEKAMQEIEDAGVDMFRQGTSPGLEPPNNNDRS